jgi:hypothetical protein
LLNLPSKLILRYKITLFCFQFADTLKWLRLGTSKYGLRAWVAPEERGGGGGGLLLPGRTAVSIQSVIKGRPLKSDEGRGFSACMTFFYLSLR